MTNTRIPTQKRSIEKRNRIIEKGFELMCEHGYHNTDTAKIAKYANVSTGIIYQYFKDKKEIFIEGVKNYSQSIMYPLIDILESETIDLNNIDALIRDIIDKLIKNHKVSKKAHEEMMAMSHLDDDIGNIFKEAEIDTTKKIVEILENNNIKVNNAFEKVHIIIDLLDNISHELVYHKHKTINYDIMIDIVVNEVKNILKN